MEALATNGSGVIVSPEVFNILNKLLKSDKENASSDVQVLCELFSGKRCSYRFVTEKVCEIAENTPFSVIGTT